MFSPDGKLSRFLSAVFDVIIIGILWFICSLPLITIIASTTAAYFTMAKVVRAGSGYMVKEFFHSFKLNIKQSLLPGLIYVFCMLVLVLDIIYVYNNRSKANDSLFIILIGIALMITMVTMYFPPMLSRFNKNNKDLFFMSSISAFRFLPITLLCLIVAIVMIVAIWLMPWAIVILPGVYLYLFTYPMEFILKK
ncbi:MAG: YesL family protein, partial [Eubacterium sp.]|nr:YesL family protein [Eubacterium sp.]